MSTITVQAVQGKSDLNEFVELPFSIYRDDKTWIPPLRIAVKELLDRKKHPFYANADAEFFLARRDGQVVGRIAAIFDRNHNTFHAESAGFFGFFECVDDTEVAKALLAKAREWTFAKGATFLRGPVNPSTNYECGLLVDGFDTGAMVMMTYNRPYYAALLESVGFRKSMDLYSYEMTAAGGALERIAKVADRALARSGVKIRTINMKDFAGEVGRVWDVYNAAWSKNWGFVPMTKEEFFLMGKEMKMIIDPEMVLIGEVNGKMIGFALALPDANYALKYANGSLLPTGLFKILWHKKDIPGVRVVALGVVEEFRTSGLAPAFYAELIRRARALGYHGTCELSWVLENNLLMRRSADLIGAHQAKTYRLYDWA